MSGIVGSRFNIKGSGLVGSLGTDGQVFTSSGTGTGHVFEDAGGGDFVKIASVAGAGDSGIMIIDECFSATYRCYKVEAMVYPDAGANCYFRLRTGGGSGADVDGANYKWTGRSSRRWAAGNGGSDFGEFAHTFHWNNETPEANDESPLIFTSTIYEPFNSAMETNAMIDWGIFSGDTYYHVDSYMSNTVTQSCTGIKLYLASGNFETTSIVTVYGVTP